MKFDIICVICKTEFINKSIYGKEKCPKCGQKYIYNEDDRIVLSSEQKRVLRDHYKMKKEKHVFYGSWRDKDGNLHMTDPFTGKVIYPKVK